MELCLEGHTRGSNPGQLGPNAAAVCQLQYRAPSRTFLPTPRTPNWSIPLLSASLTASQERAEGTTAHWEEWSAPGQALGHTMGPHFLSTHVHTPFPFPGAADPAGGLWICLKDGCSGWESHDPGPHALSTPLPCPAARTTSKKTGQMTSAPTESHLRIQTTRPKPVAPSSPAALPSPSWALGRF